jgi:hypothetical protein
VGVGSGQWYRMSRVASCMLAACSWGWQDADLGVLRLLGSCHECRSCAGMQGCQRFCVLRLCDASCGTAPMWVCLLADD